MRRPLVFVTDYGLDDTYSAALTGAALRVDPDTRCIDGTHGVPAGDVLAGTYHLKALALAFSDAVFCAVVDPGVGTARRAIAVQCGAITCVAPDNGLISYLWGESNAQQRSAVQLDVPVGASATFHGRDVFAPAAARLAAGAPLPELGRDITDPIILTDAFARREGDEVLGCVAVVDHFGNAITTIRERDLDGRRVVAVQWSGGETDRFVRTYEDIGDGLAALIGSAGHLEISATGAPSAQRGGPALHDPVTVLLG